MSTSAPPGLSIGPMDIDNSAGLTAKLGTHNKAHLLLQRSIKNFPVELTAALAQSTDVLRTEAAQEHLEEIEDAVRGLSGRRAWLRDGDDVEDVAVKGKGRKAVFSIIFRRPSGRSGRGVAAYDLVPAVERTFEEQESERNATEARKLGGFAPSGAVAQDAAVADMLARAEAVIRSVEESKRASDATVEELQDRLAAMENPEPFEGYDDLNAPDIIARVKDGGREEFGLRGLDAIAAYEHTMASPRSTVIKAVEDAKSAPASAPAE